MPAPEKIGMTGPAPVFPIERLGIIAGGGNLPLRLVIACERAGIETFIIAFEGHTDPALLAGRAHVVARMGAVGRMMRSLKERHIRDIVMIGSLRRPSLAELRPDMKALSIVLRNGLLRRRGLGDDGILRLLRREFENNGFRLHGVHRFVADVLAEPGVLGRYKPGARDFDNIRRGIAVVRALGALDVGQAGIVQDGIVLGVEGAEGTDELIRRCAAYRRKGHGAVLVKLCKPQQDVSLDLPTIGPDTVDLCAHTGMAGIAVEAGRSLILDPQDVAELADKHGLFVVALTPEELYSDA